MGIPDSAFAAERAFFFQRPPALLFEDRLGVPGEMAAEVGCVGPQRRLAKTLVVAEAIQGAGQEQLAKRFARRVWTVFT